MLDTLLISKLRGSGASILPHFLGSYFAGTSWGRDNSFVRGAHTLTLLSQILYHKEENQTQPQLPESLMLSKGKGLSCFFRFKGELAPCSHSSPEKRTFPPWLLKGRGQLPLHAAYSWRILTSPTRKPRLRGRCLFPNLPGLRLLFPVWSVNLSS